MKIQLSMLASSVLLGGLVFPGFAGAASVEVTWENPEKYTDVRPSNESRVKFKERTFKALEAYLGKLAEKLPADEKLTINVTNLDLAGQVWPSSFVFGNATGADVRIIKRVDIPRMTFSYTLTDASGKARKSAEVKLKDMGFIDNPRRIAQNDFLDYEKVMLRDWFREEMADVIVKNKVE
ncbi:DUF3016 domain-containing protein [Aestuariibacter sp. A3R04]|uniref:DUF3016 domain-containing protein n=1 Tax=Aestuariibacter sp. A3R04 TaxID=2841571 RepID=UPI001C0A2B7E|nr:DUF3016 domain-containing protein [Aestuariibacter sp. A3R04]MBU3021043.1 DUF3016 domain-containing protein [Aestuariibacter sp. A3R04]